MAKLLTSITKFIVTVGFTLFIMFVTSILNPLPKFDIKSCDHFRGFFSSLFEVPMPWKYPKSHSHEQGLIFVVDLNDKIRVLEAWDKLHAILGDITN